MSDNKNQNISKLDQRDALKRCIDSENDSLRVMLLDGAIKADVDFKQSSMAIDAIDSEGNKKSIKVDKDGHLMISAESLKMLVQPAAQAMPQAATASCECKHEVVMQQLPKEYLEQLQEVTKALNEVALKAGREVVRETTKEIPVEKIVEKQIVTKEVPKWVWILVGAQAAALLISLL